MPDGDMIYGRLRQGYEKPYEQLCEGHFGVEVIAINIVSQILKDLKRRGYGDGPVHLLFSVAEHLDALPGEPILRSTIDFGDVSRLIDRRTRELSPGQNKRAMELARDASKAHLVRYAAGMLVDDHRHELALEYLTRLYDAEFSERLPVGLHYLGTGPEIVAERLNQVRPFVIESLSSIARQMARGTRISRTRLPGRNRPPIRADTDLLALR